MIVASKRAKQVHVRWAIRRDMREILAIEAASFDFPWTEEEFIAVLRHRSNVCQVAEGVGDGIAAQVVAYVVYQLDKRRLNILNLAVHPDFRRRGIARQLIEKLQGKLSLATAGRNKLTATVSERNLPAQLFFREMGFRATAVLRNHWEEQDAFQFRYRCGGEE